MRTILLSSPLTSIFVFVAACGDGSVVSTTSGESTAGASSSGEPSSGESTSASPTPTTGDTTAGTTGDSSTASTSASDTDETSSTTDTTEASSTTDTTETSSSGSSSSSSGGDPGLGQAAQDVVAELEAAVDGVLYSSESDYPWHVVAFPDVAPVTEANVKDIIQDVYVPHDLPLADRAIEVRTLAQLMDPLTVPQPWWDDFYVMQAAQYVPIRTIFEMKLEQVQVFRLGEQSGDILLGAIDVYVLGQTADGDVVGMWSIAVET